MKARDETMNSGTHLIEGATGNATAVTCPKIESDDLQGLRRETAEHIGSRKWRRLKGPESHAFRQCS